jgi:hypothetical protein
MLSSLARSLLAVAAFILIGGALLHASAYGKVTAGIEASALSSALGNAFRALWMADSTTTAAVGLLAVLFVARPALASPPVVLLLALVPAFTGVFAYRFLGPSLPGHLMALTTVLMVVAVLLPRRAAAA